MAVTDKEFKKLAGRIDLMDKKIVKMEAKLKAADVLAVFVAKQIVIDKNGLLKIIADHDKQLDSLRRRLSKLG